MLKRICNWGAYPILVIFALILAIPVRDYLVSSLGKGATNLILLLFGIYTFFIIISQFFNVFAKFSIGIFIIVSTLCTLTICYSTLPERQYERALQESRVKYESPDRSSLKNDKEYFQRIDHANREQKLRQLELEIAELRYDSQSNLYGIKPWEKILFVTAIGLMLGYGCCWLLIEYKEVEKKL